MSIEKSSPSPSAKAVTGADPHGKKAGKTSDASGAGGFSALMSLLSATDDTAVGPATDPLLAELPLNSQSGLDGAAAVPVDSAGLLALALPAVPLTPAIDPDTALVSASILPSEPSSMANLVSATATTTAGLSAPMPAPVQMQATAAAAAAAASATPSALAALAETPAIGLAQGLAAPGTETPAQAMAGSSGLPDKGPAAGPQAKAGETAAQDMVALRHAAIAAAGDGKVAASNAPDMSQVSPVSALLAHRGVMQAQGVQAAQQELKETRAAVSSQLTGLAPDVVTTALAGVAGDMVRPPGRFGARPGSGQSGSSGFDGAFGQAMAAIHRSDAAFEVPPASAVVADTAVAETVSYWASQGVQTAELELEGFGDSPVEVSIVLNGDQAQIDFRTDQAGVRQLLEAATAQLKELLSNQGLQLAGVSVGTSGKGSEQGGERRSRQGAQQATLVKTEALGAASTRLVHPAVGRSLDLFV